MSYHSNNTCNCDLSLAPSQVLLKSLNLILAFIWSLYLWKLYLKIIWKNKFITDSYYSKLCIFKGDFLMSRTHGRTSGKNISKFAQNCHLCMCTCLIPRKPRSFYSREQKTRTFRMSAFICLTTATTLVIVILVLLLVKFY